MDSVHGCMQHWIAADVLLHFGGSKKSDFSQSHPRTCRDRMWFQSSWLVTSLYISSIHSSFRWFLPASESSQKWTIVKFALGQHQPPELLPRNNYIIIQCHGNNSVSCYVCAAMIRLLQFGAAPLPFSQLAAGWKFMDKLQKGWVLWIPPMNTTPPNVAFRYIFIPMSLALGSSVPLMPGIGVISRKLGHQKRRF